MSLDDPEGTEHGPAARRLEQQIEQLFEVFGFRRTLGRVWSAIYFSPEPICQNELRERLDLSMGLVSATLKELSHWGMIRSVSLPGSRRTFYRAHENLVGVAASVLIKRELPVVKALRKAVGAARWEASGLGDGPRQLDDRLRAIEDTAELYAVIAQMVTVIAKLPQGVVRAATEGLRDLHEHDPWRGDDAMTISGLGKFLD